MRLDGGGEAQDGVDKEREFETAEQCDGARAPRDSDSILGLRKFNWIFSL